MSSFLKYQILQFPLIIEATNNNGTELTQFQVYEGDTKLLLGDDRKTTNKHFSVGEVIPLIRVTKDGYTEALKTNYTIIDGNNTISVDMPIKVVSLIFYFSRVIMLF